MGNTWNFDFVWWITVVEIPALAGMFWLVWRTRRDNERSMSESQRQWAAGVNDLRERLAVYKLEVAKNYASIPYIKDVERRLTQHLVRIEAKLDSLGFGISGKKGVRP